MKKIYRLLAAMLRFIISIFVFAPAAEQIGALNQVFVLAGSTAMTGSTGAKIQGVDNASQNKLSELLEITQFGDLYKNRMGGLKDNSVSISGNIYSGDTTGQDVLVPGNFVMIGLYPLGTTVAGTQIKCLVESFEATYPIDGKQTFSCSLQGCAAPVSLPLRP